MPRSKGKQKGSAFERKVCKALSQWVSAGESEDLFWRSAMSGGRATVGQRRGKSHSRHAGDISATSREGHALTDHWYVECKAYRNLSIDSAMIKSTGFLIKFWDEAVTQAARYKKLPMLIAKQNQVPTIVLVPIGETIDRRSHIGTFLRMGCDVMDFRLMLKAPFKLSAVAKRRRRERL
jgi:hypothetical protein